VERIDRQKVGSPQGESTGVGTSEQRQREATVEDALEEVAIIPDEDIIIVFDS
jgi:hypothetical protein